MKHGSLRCNVEDGVADQDEQQQSGVVCAVHVIASDITSNDDG